AVDLRQPTAATPARGAGVRLRACALLVQRHPGPHHTLARGDGLEATLEIGAWRVVAGFECRKLRVERERGKEVRLVASGHQCCLPCSGVCTGVTTDYPEAHGRQYPAPAQRKPAVTA